MYDLTYIWNLKKTKVISVFSPTGKGRKWDFINVPGRIQGSVCARILESHH